jgi:hypothetical protein
MLMANGELLCLSSPPVAATDASALLSHLLRMPPGIEEPQVIEPSSREDLEELLVTANTMAMLDERVWKGSHVLERLSEEVSWACQTLRCCLRVW